MGEVGSEVGATWMFSVFGLISSSGGEWVVGVVVYGGTSCPGEAARTFLWMEETELILQPDKTEEM